MPRSCCSDAGDWPRCRDLRTDEDFLDRPRNSTTGYDIGAYQH